MVSEIDRLVYQLYGLKEDDSECYRRDTQSLTERFGDGWSGLPFRDGKRLPV